MNSPTREPGPKTSRFRSSPPRARGSARACSLYIHTCGDPDRETDLSDHRGAVSVGATPSSSRSLSSDPIADARHSGRRATGTAQKNDDRGRLRHSPGGRNGARFRLIAFSTSTPPCVMARSASRGRTAAASTRWSALPSLAPNRPRIRRRRSLTPWCGLLLAPTSSDRRNRDDAPCSALHRLRPTTGSHRRAQRLDPHCSLVSTRFAPAFHKPLASRLATRRTIHYLALRIVARRSLSAAPSSPIADVMPTSRRAGPAVVAGIWRPS